MFKVRIIKIDWLDYDSKEADVFFELGTGKYWAFCHPCVFCEGEERYVNIDFLYLEDISWETMFSSNIDEKMKLVQSSNDRDSYYCYGKVIHINPIVVDCGDIQFDLGEMTNDNKVVGSWIYFIISRLDIF